MLGIYTACTLASTARVRPTLLSLPAIAAEARNGHIEHRVLALLGHELLICLGQLLDLRFVDFEFLLLLLVAVHHAFEHLFALSQLHCKLDFVLRLLLIWVEPLATILSELLHGEVSDEACLERLLVKRNLQVLLLLLLLTIIDTDWSYHMRGSRLLNYGILGILRRKALHVSNVCVKSSDLCATTFV